MANGWWHRVRGRIADLPWAGLAGKGVVWGAAFGALAWIGAGAAQRVTPAREAVPLLPRTSASAFFGATPTASSPGPPCRDKAEHVEGGVLPDGRVVLNRAGAADLTKLPGIGEKRARAIVELRDRLGGKFRSLRDLLRVRGIGLAMLRRIEPHAVLDAPQGEAAAPAASGAALSG